MLDFNKYLMKYGEFGIQALIERIERYEGIKASIDTPLEDRWAYLMQTQSSQQMAA